MAVAAFQKGAVVLGVAAIGCAVALSCVSPVDNAAGTVPGKCQIAAPLIEAIKTDILFVVDDSDSMADKQAAVAQELPSFVAELQRGSGIAQDFRIGLITTSVYQKAYIDGVGMTYREYPNLSGKLQPVPAATDGGVPGGERILSGSDPDLVEKFSRLVKVGVSGSGQETPFEAARLALSSPLTDGGGTNAGFLRDGARLLVVVVSDEDDCSEMVRPPQVNVGVGTSTDWCGQMSDKLTPVGDYKAFFDNLPDGKGGKREVLWAAIAPVALSDKHAEAIVDGQYLRNADCPTSHGPGFRHLDMATRFDPTLSDLDSICDPSYHDALLTIAAIANTASTIEVVGVPDPNLLKVEITRGDGTVTSCTLSNGGITYEPPTADRTGRVHFEPSCPRQRDDVSVQLKMLCAG